jgi:hypothetical protein
MITIDIDQASLKSITRKLGLKQKQTEEKIKAGIKAGLLLITNEAKIKVPVLSGHLKRSIHDEPVRNDSGGFSGRVGTNVKYGPKIEFGGSRKAPAGYLRPALDEKGQEAVIEIVSSLKQIL